jgi:hypothetical protein
MVMWTENAHIHIIHKTQLRCIKIIAEKKKRLTPVLDKRFDYQDPNFIHSEIRLPYILESNPH